MNRLIIAIGMFIIIAGTLISPSSTWWMPFFGETFLGLPMTFAIAANICFFFGGLLTFWGTWREGESLFIALQGVILSGVLAAFLLVPTYVKIAIPVATAIFVLVFFALTSKLKTKNDSLGALGIALLALGYATSQPLIYMLGGAVVALFSLFSLLQGSRVALLYLLLNSLFSITSGITVYHNFVQLGRWLI